jgi:hypothetical protein
VCGVSCERPPPILASWNASWIRRAASAAWSARTTNEMFRSDEPCATAITLSPARASAVNTRAAMPGVPAMPSPTTAMTATSVRDATSSTSPLASSSLNARRSACTAGPASAAGSVNPMELSDEAWKMVDTDSPAACTAANVRAAMPGTPIMPLPETVTTAWPRMVASAFTG